MTTIKNGYRRIAYCECGAQLAGDSEQELFAAAQRHLAHHHPQLLGALELETVHRWPRTSGGDDYGRPGALTPTGGRCADHRPPWRSKGDLGSGTVEVRSCAGIHAHVRGVTRAVARC